MLILLSHFLRFHFKLIFGFFCYSSQVKLKSVKEQAKQVAADRQEHNFMKIDESFDV